MQQYAGIYLLQNYSTCFGCLGNELPQAWPNQATLAEGRYPDM